MSVAKPSSVNRYIQMPSEACAAPLIALPFSAILVGAADGAVNSQPELTKPLNAF